MDLIERLEKATEGSRELDARIAYAIGWRFSGFDDPPLDTDFADCDILAGHWHRPGDRFAQMSKNEDPGDKRWREPPHYTTSIDAALSLVPKEWVWAICNMRHYSGDGWQDESGRLVCSAEVHPDVAPVPGHLIFEAESKVAALALCIAALRARQSQEAR